jgi:aminodeoxychorismate synthase component I
VAALRVRPHFWWLDSALPGPALGRFSYAGSDPWGVLRCFGCRIVADVRRRVHPAFPVGRRSWIGDPLDAIQDHMPPSPLGDHPPFPFVGGSVGVLGYELAEQFEPVSLGRGAGLGLADLSFLLVDRLLAFDHLEGRGWVLGLGIDAEPGGAALRAEAAVGALSEQVCGAPSDQGASATSTTRGAQPALEIARGFDQTTHAKAIHRALEAIAEGEVYQVCLTHRLETAFAGGSWRLHSILRELNPAPFAACLELPDAAVVSSSPERFLQVSADGWVESRPIKGTRPRHADLEADRAEQLALRRSEKDRAENLMIVDLVRNDLGRVCETGSIHVPELMAVESYATVFQMVSTVRGRLRADCDAFDAVRASFPPGSMTGAPKLAAMRLLAELETGRRGFYSGALGYFDARGGCGLSVVIRSAILKDGAAHVHTGGGIVADSNPAEEWCEAEDKARALLAALSAAREVG